MEISTPTTRKRGRMIIKQTIKDGVEFFEQTIEELTKERDYLDARCAALENDLVLDDVVSKLEKVQTRLADFENLARDFVKYKAPDHICRMHFEMMLKESEE